MFMFLLFLAWLGLSIWLWRRQWKAAVAQMEREQELTREMESLRARAAFLQGMISAGDRYGRPESVQLGARWKSGASVTGSWPTN